MRILGYYNRSCNVKNYNFPLKPPTFFLFITLFFTFFSFRLFQSVSYSFSLLYNLIFISFPFFLPYSFFTLFIAFLSFFSQLFLLQRMSQAPNRCQLVRKTCLFVHQQSKHVTINQDKLVELAEKYQPGKKFEDDQFHHTSQDPELALLQLFMLDFMNFCFWPLPEFQYEHLASNIRLAVQEGITLKVLEGITEEEVVGKIFHGAKVPQADERARILQELASTVRTRFDGSFVKLIEKSEKSAIRFLNLLTENFRNFQDHMIYKGHQVHFYKRSQILIGDIYSKFKGKGLGEFLDIQELTMFPDYRVPQILQAEGVF